MGHLWSYSPAPLQAACGAKRHSKSSARRWATPAMAAGVSDRLWEIGDIVKLVEDTEAKPGKRGPYKKHNAN